MGQPALHALRLRAAHVLLARFPRDKIINPLSRGINLYIPWVLGRRAEPNFPPSECDAIIVAV